MHSREELKRFQREQQTRRKRREPSLLLLGPHMTLPPQTPAEEELDCPQQKQPVSRVREQETVSAQGNPKSRGEKGV